MGINDGIKKANVQFGLFKMQNFWSICFSAGLAYIDTVFLEKIPDLFFVFQIVLSRLVKISSY